MHHCHYQEMLIQSRLFNWLQLNLNRAAPLAVICVHTGGGGFPPSSHTCRRRSGGGALSPLQVQRSNYLLFTGLSAPRLPGDN